MIPRFVGCTSGCRVAENRGVATRENKEDVQQVRQTFNLSQDMFAKFMGVSVGTLRNWEQGRRHPSGAARVLLRIAIRQPKLFADVVSEDYPEMVLA